MVDALHAPGSPSQGWTTPSAMAVAPPRADRTELIEQWHQRCAALGLSRVERPDFDPMRRSAGAIARSVRCGRPAAEPRPSPTAWSSPGKGCLGHEERQPSVVSCPASLSRLLVSGQFDCSHRFASFWNTPGAKCSMPTPRRQGCHSSKPLWGTVPGPGRYREGNLCTRLQQCAVGTAIAHS